MEIRLNKLLSKAGICSRREADELIEMGRVTVNGAPSRLGQHVTEEDIVEVDGERVRFSKRMAEEELQAAATRAVATRENEKARREHYGKFNKYAAARHAARGEGGETRKPSGRGQHTPHTGKAGSGKPYGNTRGASGRGQRGERRGR